MSRLAFKEKAFQQQPFAHHLDFPGRCGAFEMASTPDAAGEETICAIIKINWIKTAG